MPERAVPHPLVPRRSAERNSWRRWRLLRLSRERCWFESNSARKRAGRLTVGRLPTAIACSRIPLCRASPWVVEDWREPMRLNLKIFGIHGQTHEGALAAPMNATQALRRSVMSCLLWENEFYEDGEEIAVRIARL